MRVAIAVIFLWTGALKFVPYRRDRGRHPSGARPATPSEVKFAADSLLEGDGFEPSVPGEGKPTHASATFDRYRRLSPAIRHLRLPTCGGSDSSRYGCGWHPVHR
jgi:hypothetical protein